MSFRNRNWAAMQIRTNYRINGDCMEWGGSKNSQGYGVVCFGGVTMRAHRLSFEVHHGQIPDGMLVCHRCDNPPCINPEHLWLGTHYSNLQDMIQKKRNKRIDDTGLSTGFSKEDVLSIRRMSSNGVLHSKIAEFFKTDTAWIYYWVNYRWRAWA